MGRRGGATTALRDHGWMAARGVKTALRSSRSRGSAPGGSGQRPALLASYSASSCWQLTSSSAMEAVLGRDRRVSARVARSVGVVISVRATLVTREVMSVATKPGQRAVARTPWSQPSWRVPWSEGDDGELGHGVADVGVADAFAGEGGEVDDAALAAGLEVREGQADEAEGGL